MRNSYKVTLGILTIMILVTITVGTSYSFYSATDVQTNPNTVATTCFDLSFTDSNSITLNASGSYAYPMSEATALSKLTPYKFTVTNTCDTGQSIKYDVTMNTLTSTTSTLTSYLKYKLNVTAPTASTGTTSALTNTYSMDATLKSQQGVDTSYLLSSGTLAPGETKTYNLYMWIDENAGNEVMGYTFNGKVLVYAYM